MRIVIEIKHGIYRFFICSEPEPDIDGDYLDCCEIIDEGWNNITLESEALCRASSLRSATGWEIVKDYE